MEEIGEIAEERERDLELKARLGSVGFKEGLGFMREGLEGKWREKERGGRRESGDMTLVVCRSSIVFRRVDLLADFPLPLDNLSN